MTLPEAAADFRREFETAPWLQGVACDSGEGRIVAYTVFPLPEALRERLREWHDWPVEFKVSGRICLD